MKNKVLDLVRSALPTEVKHFIIRLYRRFEISRLYRFDKQRFIKNAYDFTNDYSKNNLRSKITFNYHSIEKGLSNANLRLGFGKKALSELFSAMDKYIECEYSLQDKRFQQAISVLQEYVKLHNQKSYSVDWVTQKLALYEKYFIESYTENGGYEELHSDSLLNYESLNFKDLAINRHSIRDFGEDKINQKDIIEAIQISTKTPSVCNRQAYKVYYIQDYDKMNDALSMQGGLKGNGENIQGLILVTSNREYMMGYHERNQTYIDGGMFLMSLIYSLTYKNIATCALNANFTLKKEKEMRSLLDVSFSEDLICFIALGSYPEVIKYAKSPRDIAEEITMII